MKRPNGYTFEDLKRMRKIIVSITVLAVIAAIYFWGYANAKGKFEKEVAKLEQENQTLSDSVVVYENATKEVDLSVIVSQIRDIKELATVEYLYTDASEYRDPVEFFGREVPFDFTTKSFIAKWDGTIKAGIDVNRVTVEEDKEKKVITVSIPPAKVISHETENYETIYEKDGLFNEVKVDDVRAFDDTCKQSMEQRAIEHGLLEKANENAKEIITSLVNTETVKELGYTVVFCEIENEP